MKERLTTVERRALDMCRSIQEWGKASFAVEWKHSRVWGKCPSILWRGEKVSHASGCGYCKHSACLAAALQFMANTVDGRRAIAITSGCGVPSVIRALDAAGWTLMHVAESQSSDCYEIRRKPDL